MKYFILLLIVILPFIGITQPLSVLFHENFELPSESDSMISNITTGGSPCWNITPNLFVSPGFQSIRAQVQTSTVSYLTSQSFSTIGQSLVKLKFSQICKIDLADQATIEVSNNNGTTWTVLTGAQYLGTGQFTTNGNRFASNSYGALWVPGLPSQVPLNSWWKSEEFDITSLVSGYPYVKVRFRLADAGTPGPNSNYGWLLDNIVVEGDYPYIPPLQVGIIASDTIACNGLSVQLSGTASNGGGNYTFSWTSIPAGFTSTQQNILVSPLSTTTYFLTASDGSLINAANVTITIIPAVASVEGSFRYLNPQNTELPNAAVSLYSGSTLVSSVNTDPSGNYQFGITPAGTYTLKANTGPVWGGVNALDALNVAKHYLNMDPLSGLFLQSADVNADLMVNSVDALLVLKRYVGMQNSFPAGDWVFEEKMVTLGCSGITTETLHVLCSGDTNGSWQP